MRIVNPTAIIGENLAAEYLRKKGYKIIERNFRRRYGEIDIIASNDDTLVFFEVKTRKSILYGTPLEAITRWKLQELVRTAQFYKLAHRHLPELMRIDAISITLNHENRLDTIEHIENISA